MNFYSADTLVDALTDALAAMPSITHAFHGYKSLDLVTGERPELVKPFIAVSIPYQGQSDHPKANSFQQPYRDYTKVAIYVESPLTVDDGSTKRGGFDTQHLPAVNFVRDFIHANRTLTVPAALTEAESDLVAMTPDSPFEYYNTMKDGHRTVFYVLLSYFTTTNDEEAS